MQLFGSISPFSKHKTIKIHSECFICQSQAALKLISWVHCLIGTSVEVLKMIYSLPPPPWRRAAHLKDSQHTWLCLQTYSYGFGTDVKGLWEPAKAVKTPEGPADEGDLRGFRLIATYSRSHLERPPPRAKHMPCSARSGLWVRVCVCWGALSLLCTVGPLLLLSMWPAD